MIFLYAVFLVTSAVLRMCLLFSLKIKDSHPLEGEG